MSKIRKRLFLSLLISVLFVLLFQMQTMAAHWYTDYDSSASGNIVTLTQSQSGKYGGYFNSVPIDTRRGFTVSFEYCISEPHTSRYFRDPEAGILFIMTSAPIQLSTRFDMGYWQYIHNDPANNDKPFINFYGLELRDGRYIRAVTNNVGDCTDRSTLTSYDYNLADGVWHRIHAEYHPQNHTLTVYQDGTCIFSCPNINPSALAYIGFSASTGTSSYAKHQIRNISVNSTEACTVYLNANGGTLDSTFIYAVPNTRNSIPVPKRDGYTFTGWYTLPSGGKKITDGNHPFSTTDRIYAQWTPNTYTITFDPRDGKCSKTQTTVTYNTAYNTNGSLPVPTRTGYSFDGWYTGKYNGTRVTGRTRMTISENHTLYARWSVQMLTIKFNPNKGTLSKSKQKLLLEYGHALTSLPTPKRKNYSFLGWYTKKTGGSKIQTGKAIKSNKTYYAHWVKSSKKVKIKLNKNGGSCKKSSITVTYGGKLKGLPKATRKGYTFQGWYTKKSGGTKVTSSTKTIKFVSDTKTLYAHWYKKSTSSGSSSGSSSSSSGNNKYSPNCTFCGGDGDCTRCGGDGREYFYGVGSNSKFCSKCNGSGRCTFCHGSGKRY